MKLLLFFISVFVFAVQPSLAQSCVDSDGGSNPAVAGTVTIGTTVYRDYCPPDGGQVREMTCSGSTLGTEFIACPEGCVDGACAGHTLDKNGCYFRLRLKVDLTSSTPSITVLSALPDVGRYGRYALSIPPEKSTESIEIDLYSAQGALLGRYPFSYNPTLYIENQLPRVIPVTSPTFYIPYFRNLSKIEFVRSGVTLGSYVISPAQVVCKRPCVPPGRSGWTNTQQCCSGATSVPINKKSFMCVATPSPSPSPIPK